jgi:transcription initiation factor IIE alpha subunit
MATTNDNKALRYKRSASALQKVWNYIRRNRVFRFGDVMMVVGVRHEYLRNLLWHLEGAGYIKCEDTLKTNTNSIFRVVRMSGAKSPSIINGVVYDYNTDEKFEIKRKKPLEKILEALKSLKSFTKEELARASGVSESSVKKALSELKDRGVIYEYERQIMSTKKLFGRDLDALEEVLSERA